jgi:hypothetical protein
MSVLQAVNELMGQLPAQATPDDLSKAAIRTGNAIQIRGALLGKDATNLLVQVGAARISVKISDLLSVRRLDEPDKTGDESVLNIIASIAEDAEVALSTNASISSVASVLYGWTFPPAWIYEWWLRRRNAKEDEEWMEANKEDSHHYLRRWVPPENKDLRQHEKEQMAIWMDTSKTPAERQAAYMELQSILAKMKENLEKWRRYEREVEERERLKEEELQRRWEFERHRSDGYRGRTYPGIRDDPWRLILILAGGGR